MRIWNWLQRFNLSLVYLMFAAIRRWNLAADCLTFSTRSREILVRRETAVFMKQQVNQASTEKKAYNYGPLLHTKLSKLLWQQVLKPGDIAIDATCGNGNDALCIAEILGLGSTSDAGIIADWLSSMDDSFTMHVHGDMVGGSLHCLDIQQDAIDNTRRRFASESSYSPLLDRQIHFHCQSHVAFPEELQPGTVSLIVYNLGYLPGKPRPPTAAAAAAAAAATTTSDVESMPNYVKTEPSNTVISLAKATRLIREGGMISVTAYTGHPGGAEELQAVQVITPPSGAHARTSWCCAHHHLIVCSTNSLALLLAYWYACSIVCMH